MSGGRWILLPLFFVSGMAGLGYQMIWAKMFSLGLGHEMPAVLAVVASFMGGMALGTWTLDGFLARSRAPGAWYAVLEGTIALWGALTAILIPWLNETLPGLIGPEPSAGRHWLISFALPCLALLPSTFALGATFPAMERFLAPWTAQGRCVGAVYAANTLGAVAGTLTSLFLVAPVWGLPASLLFLASLNAFCAATAWVLQKKILGSRPTVVSPPTGAQLAKPAWGEWKRGPITLLLTGLLGIGFEVVGIRVLSQIMENTVYTFASVLAVFLLGLSLGGAGYQRLGGRRSFSQELADILGIVSLLILVELSVLKWLPWLYRVCRVSFGDSPLGVMSAEFLTTAAIFLLPTLWLGALFSHLVQAAKRPQGGVGRAAALNMLGGSLAGALFGVGLLPLLGSKWTLAGIALGYLILVPRFQGWRWGYPAVATVLVVLLPANLMIVDVPPSGHVVDYREGVMASVSVVDDATGNRTLRVNNRFQMGGTAAASAEQRQGLMPLVLHGHPRRALFLGVGTGISLGAATLFPDLSSDGVELVPEVLDVLPRFAPANRRDHYPGRVMLYRADAARFVRSTPQRYDVIVADLFHPARDGAGFLYTVEHFRSIRDRLQPDGLFCQWLPLHQLDEPTLKTIVRSFLEVFPEAQAWLLRFNVDVPVLGLIGPTSAVTFSVRQVEAWEEEEDLMLELSKMALGDSLRLFGCYLTGAPTLRAWAGQAPLNTANHPLVTFSAPRFTYDRNTTSYGRLMTLISQARDESVDSWPSGKPPDNEFTERLRNYWQARNVYLRGLVEDAEGRASNAVDAYLESARLSPEFTSGYAQCLRLAGLMASSQPEQARRLLERLIEAQPERPVARQMLERLFGK